MRRKLLAKPELADTSSQGIEDYLDKLVSYKYENKRLFVNWIEKGLFLLSIVLVLECFFIGGLQVQVIDASHATHCVSLRNQQLLHNALHDGVKVSTCGK